MSTRAEAKATVGDISNDGNLNMAQVQTSRKGKIMCWLCMQLNLCYLDFPFGDI